MVLLIGTWHFEGWSSSAFRHVRCHDECIFAKTVCKAVQQFILAHHNRLSYQEAQCWMVNKDDWMTIKLKHFWPKPPTSTALTKFLITKIDLNIPIFRLCKGQTWPTNYSMAWLETLVHHFFPFKNYATWMCINLIDMQNN